MKVYALVFTIGISSGYKQLIGIYDDWNKANEALDKDMKICCHANHHYSIHEIELNEEVNITFAEW